jgi:hypothetical protein
MTSSHFNDSYIDKFKHLISIVLHGCKHLYTNKGTEMSNFYQQKLTGLTHLLLTRN